MRFLFASLLLVFLVQNGYGSSATKTCNLASIPQQGTNTLNKVVKSNNIISLTCTDSLNAGVANLTVKDISTNLGTILFCFSTGCTTPAIDLTCDAKTGKYKFIAYSNPSGIISTATVISCNIQ